MAHPLVFPMASVVFLTILILTIAFLARVAAVRGGHVRMRYFKTFDDGEPTALVVKTTRHYANLFEMPVLFYAGCLAAIATHTCTRGMVLLAWVFVAARVVHAVIHIGPNVVLPRLLSFA